MKLLSRTEAAEMLQISEQNLDYIIRRDGIPTIKLGSTRRSRIRIDEEDLINWINNRKSVKKPLE